MPLINNRSIIFGSRIPRTLLSIPVPYMFERVRIVPGNDIYMRRTAGPVLFRPRQADSGVRPLPRVRSVRYL